MICCFFLAVLTSSVRDCNDMRFCRDNFEKQTKWTIDPSSVSVSDESDVFTANIKDKGVDANLQLKITFIQQYSIRVQFIPLNTEKFHRFKYSEEELLFTQEVLNDYKQFEYSKDGKKSSTLTTKERKIKIQYSPLKLTVEDEFGSSVDINSDNLLLFEHEGKHVDSETYDDYLDLIKNGATAVGADFSFRGADTRIFGFDERDEDMNIVDVENPVRVSVMDGYPRYGKIPMVYGHSQTQMISIFWFNPSDTFYRTKTYDDRRSIRIVSEGGFLDFVVFTGHFHDIVSSYTEISGRSPIPPIWSLGYQQSKYGYKDQAECEDVYHKLEEINFPLDVFWFDIDHLKGQAPFIINTDTFPNIPSFIEMLKKDDRYLVRINDPHLPTWDDHPQYQEAKKNRYFVRNPDYSDFVGECWPGATSWPDYYDPDVRNWWGSLYHYEADPIHNKENVYFWNDMNEATVYNVIDGKLPKDTIHFNGIEDRELHNAYGMYSNVASWKGLSERDPNDRPFLLSRAFGPGTQRYAFTWTGDCWARWDFFRRAVQIQSNVGLEGIVLFGSDLGGFSYETSPELMTRWMQVGAFMFPFFRNHADSFSPRREPYLFPPEYCALMLKATILRYQFTPFLYRNLKTFATKGIPPVQPLFTLYPEIDTFHDNQVQYIIGESIMICPVLDEGAESIKIEVPPGRWYAYPSGEKIENDDDKKSKIIDLPVTIESIPLYLKQGSIIPIFSKTGKNMAETVHFPLTILTTPDENGFAEGEIYLDDGKTLNYTKGQFIHRRLVYRNYTLKMEMMADEIAAKSAANAAKSVIDFELKHNYIEKMIVFGDKFVDEGNGKRRFVPIEKSINVRFDDGEKENVYMKKKLTMMMKKENKKDSLKSIAIVLAVVAALAGVAIAAIVIVNKKRNVKPIITEEKIKYVEC